MTILILEDEPIIAVDLEEIVSGHVAGDVVIAACLSDALTLIKEQGKTIDFALLDLQLGRDGSTSIPIAKLLIAARIPFCFVSAATDAIPGEMRNIPQVSKPFAPREIQAVLPLAA